MSQIDYSVFPIISTQEFSFVEIDALELDEGFIAMLSFFKDEEAENGNALGFTLDTTIYGDTLDELSHKVGLLFESGLFDALEVNSHGTLWSQEGEPSSPICWLHEGGVLDHTHDEEPGTVTVSLKKDNEEIPDFEPMIIDYGKKTWVHPYIDTWCDFEKADWGDDNEMVDFTVHRMMVDSPKGYFHITFKSDFLQKKSDEMLDSENFKIAYNLSDSQMRALLSTVSFTLTDDLWRPMPKPIAPIKNSRQWADAVESLNDPSQFIYTEVGSEIAEFLSGTWKASITPDVSISKNQEKYYWQT